MNWIVISEQELLVRLGLTTRQLRDLEARGMPYLKVNQDCHLYGVGSVQDFLIGLMVCKDNPNA